MSKIWNDAEQDAASECEKLFQNGGPRVYVQQDGDSIWKLKPSAMSATKTLRNYAMKGDLVLARRKEGQRYVWKVAKGQG